MQVEPLREEGIALHYHGAFPMVMKIFNTGKKKCIRRV